MNRNRKNIWMFAAVITWMPMIMTAQSAPELQKDRQAIASDQHRGADDRRDVDRLSDLVIRWDSLRKSAPNSIEFRQVENQIFLELRRDLKETSVKTQQAEAEAWKSKTEVEKSQKEKRREKWDRDHDRRALRDDRKDARDDKKDLRDDVQDAKKIEDLLSRKQSKAEELVALQKVIDTPGKSGDKALQQKQKMLLEDYLKLSQEEIQMGVREKAEDRRELREDRGEAREDRR